MRVYTMCVCVCELTQKGLNDLAVEGTLNTNKQTYLCVRVCYCYRQEKFRKISRKLGIFF